MRIAGLSFETAFVPSPFLTAVRAGLMVLLATAAANLPAQERNARVYGVVSDKSGALIPGIDVSLTNRDTGVRTILVTNSVGVYNAPKLVTGPYLLEAELAGFKKLSRSGIEFLPGDVVEINITLEVGNVNDVVNVTEQAPLVNTTSGTNRTSLETEID